MLERNVARLFREQVTLFEEVELTQASIMAGGPEPLGILMISTRWSCWHEDRESCTCWAIHAVLARYLTARNLRMCLLAGFLSKQGHDRLTLGVWLAWATLANCCSLFA